MDELSLKRLRQFATVAETGAISDAAALLHLSASALSVSLKHLETELGVTLLIRRAGEGVVLTPEGTELAARARALLTHATELRDALDSTVSGPSAPVQLGSLTTVAPLLVPRLIRRFTLTNARVPVELHTAAQDGLIAKLIDGSIHVAVTYDLAIGSTVTFEPLVDARPWVMLPARHRFAHRASLTLDELRDEPLVALDLPLSREYFQSMFLAHGLPYRPAYRVSEMEMARTFVGNGLGWSLVNLRPPGRSTIDGSRLAYVPLASGHPLLRLGLATARGRRFPASVESFIATARRELIAILDEVRQ